MTKAHDQARETDWGIPLPGELLPKTAWTDTHLRRLPLGRLEPDTLFGRVADCVVELGCGNGRFTITSALARPEFNFLAVDVFPGAIRHAVRRANRRGQKNVYFAVADAADVLRRIAPGAVSELHIYHPQPIYDLALAHKRLLTPAVLLDAWRALKPQGLLVLQTDHPSYWEYMRSAVPCFFDFTEHPDPWPDAPEGRTRREILARQLGLPVFRALCHPRRDLDIAAARRQAEHLPLPRFDADRRLQSIEEKEKTALVEDEF